MADSKWTFKQLDRLTDIIPVAVRIGETMVNKFGEDSQLDMVVEECAEFTVERCHALRGRPNHGKLVEETGDVLMTILQAMLICGPDAVMDSMESKIDRLRKHVGGTNG